MWVSGTHPLPWCHFPDSQQAQWSSVNLILGRLCYQKSNNKVESDVPTLFCSFQIMRRIQCWVQDALEENKEDCWESRNCTKKKKVKALQCFISFGKFFFLLSLLLCYGVEISSALCVATYPGSLLDSLFLPLPCPATLQHPTSA